MTTARSLAEISRISDDDIVRVWLAERGLVAVERAVMEPLCGTGNPHGLIYEIGADRYVYRKRQPPAA